MNQNLPEDLLEDMPEKHDEINEQPSVLRRVLIRGIGLFLIILIIVGFILAETLLGVIGSVQIDSVRLTHPQATITFTPAALNSLRAHYIANEHREIKACLSGNITADAYAIDTIFFPPINSASVVHINTPRCPQETLIDLHSHPVRRCLASEQDLRVYRSLLPTNPDLLMLIMCSTTRFSVYTSQNT